MTGAHRDGRSALRLALRVPSFLLVNALAIPAYALCLGPARRWRRPIQILWCRAMCRLAGLRIHESGQPRLGGPTLYVCNHVSYLDIAVLSRRLRGVFVAKAEVSRWPLFGVISRLTETVFVSRHPAEVRAQRARIRAHLAAGGNLLLFPEGTSTDGSAVAPFKAALLDIATGRGGTATASGDADAAVVQPITIAYPRSVDGTALTGPRAELYCWFGEMTLLPHLLRVLAMPGADVELRFHEPVRPANFASRKALALHCQGQVAAGVAAAHSASPATDRAAE